MNEFLNTTTLKNAGLVLIIISLIFSWVLTVYRYMLKVDEAKVNTQYILKGHIDYLLMGFLLLILSFLGGQPNSILVLLSCFGTFANPTMFIVLAFNQNIEKSPKSLFGMLTTISYIFTTVGVGGIAIYHLMGHHS
ncbi:hypothetical protein [Flavobacterium sp.]|uniref:hypothetical protein n=1 Tax=Flavobacterium sp. TaxID=239 RepID=UPI00261417AD|nr:hypothetical protein [Flavobacterium sp.]